jgi:leucyl-tRNA synthetase
VLVACGFFVSLQDAAAGPADPTKFSGKKSKAMSKKGAGATQWEILMKSGIPPEEIPQFRLVI